MRVYSCVIFLLQTTLLQAPSLKSRHDFKDLVLSAEINFGTLNADGVITINEKGADIAGLDNAAPYFLVGGRSDNKLEDLARGKDNVKVF